MRYTARDLTAAHEGPVLRIGPSDATLRKNRSVRGRVVAWWVKHCRTWRPKPLSVPQMLALQAARSDPLRYFAVLVPIMRAVLPRRWWYRFVGDPVRLIFALPKDVAERMLQAMVTAPYSDRDVSRETDPIELIREAQRQTVHGAQRSGALTLAVAALSVREKFGDAWYWNPKRWPTTDGYVPFAVALVEATGVQSLDVRRRIEVADGFSLAHAKDPRREREKMHQLAYPAEVC